jgi:polysaccharide biosynthesis transport protein
MNEVSPFLRRTVAPHQLTTDLQEFSVVQDQVHPLRDYWLIIQRHGWLILGTAFFFLVCALIYAFTTTPLYTAQTVLLIERKAPQILKVQDTRADSVDYNNGIEFYKTQYEILKSSALAERIIRGEGFEINPLFAGTKNDQTTKGGPVGNLWNQMTTWTRAYLPAKLSHTAPDPGATTTRLVSAYLSMLQVRPVTGTSLVQIKFTTPDPVLSAQLANAHASAYLRYGIDLRSQTNEEASKFLQQKLAELKERVQQSEAALNGYRREKGIISVDDKQNIVVDRLLDLNKSLTAAEADRIGLEVQVHTIRGRNSDELPAVLGSGVISSFKSELGKLEVEYASLSKEFKPGYPALDNLKARIEETRRRLGTEIRNQVNAIEAPYLVAKAKETELRTRMEEQKKLTLNLNDSAVQYAILAREVDMNRQLYDGVLQRLKEIGVAAEDRSSNIYVMGNAEPPLGPSHPNKRLILLIALCTGPAAGLALACLLERLDNTFTSPEEAERYLLLPSLGVVPDFALLNGTQNSTRGGYISRLVSSAKAELPSRLTKQAKNSERQLLSDHHPMSIVTEAYRGLRSSLLLSQAGGAPQAVLVTSAVCGEGKTTTLINAAIIFAQMDIRVLIIDADLRRPRCHTFLKMQRTVGLTEHLAGQVELHKAIAPTRIGNLSLMSSGSSPPNPAELLGSKKMQDTLQELRGQYEFIFIDSSPVMVVSDALLLSTHTDGVLLVIDSRTPKQIIKKASTRLTTTHTKILGILLNGTDIRKRDFGGYYRHYFDYYQDDPDMAVATFHDDERPQDFLTVISAKLIETMGPMAPRVLNDHILALGESADSFPKDRRKELIERVSSEILTDSFRRQFENEMMKEIEDGSARDYDGAAREA